VFIGIGNGFFEPVGGFVAEGKDFFSGDHDVFKLRIYQLTP
jgi:hypothetical protein